MNETYYKMLNMIVQLNPIKLKLFLRKISNGYCFDNERPMTICVSMWAQAENDAKRKELFKVAKIQARMCGREVKKEDRESMQKQITAILKSAEKKGCEAAEIERMKQLSILEKMI